MKVEIPIPERTLFPGELLTVKIDVTGGGEADGVYLSADALRELLSWEAENRREWADFVAIVEADG